MEDQPVLIDYCHTCGEELFFSVVHIEPFSASARCTKCCQNRFAEDGDYRGNYNNVPWMARRAGILST